MKKLNGIHTCTNSFISQDHVRLDSSVIAHNIVHLVKTNSGINSLVRRSTRKEIESGNNFYHTKQIV